MTATDDPYRLPRHVIPDRYEIRLEPDLDNALFHGQETVTVTVVQTTTAIVVNAVDLSVGQAYLENDRKERLDASIELDETLQRCRFTFAQAVTPGQWRLTVAFHGTLNDKLRGFYRSTYKDASGATQTMAATQFEATDARRAFPCWDEPDFKAVFATTLVVDPRLTAVLDLPGPTTDSNEHREADAHEPGAEDVGAPQHVPRHRVLGEHDEGERREQRAVDERARRLAVTSAPGASPSCRTRCPSCSCGRPTLPAARGAAAARRRRPRR